MKVGLNGEPRMGLGSTLTEQSQAWSVIFKSTFTLVALHPSRSDDDVRFSLWGRAKGCVR